MNRLADSTSPYLLQHASNPVDWFEWGEEAFSEARRRGVPIFLSIGYSTCYWCHVMERESFESEATARVMNERFVCVKLDREQRPDVDDIYMTATQIMTGRGGWPMSVFLEPDTLKPFYCGTYFPPEPRHGLPSFTQVLTAMSEAFAEQRADVQRQAESVAEAVGEQVGSTPPPVGIGPEQVQEAVGSLLRMADTHRGGFGGAPKFPQPSYLDLLLEVRAASDEATRTALDQVCRVTLDQMMIGGIHDQIGGGFHRYSVDAEWTVPHFEKMLYDNAQLASTYAAAAAIYGDDGYAWVVRRTLDAVARDLSHKDGAFLSAIDAEVDSREGLNYLWDADEVRSVLSDDDAAWASSVFGLDAGPNFQDPHHAEDPPRFVLRLAERPQEPADDWRRRFEQCSSLLLRVRDEREQPHTDDKVLASWNGMMIRAFADGFALTKEAAYLDRAIAAARFVRDNMIRTDAERAERTLRRAWRDGRTGEPGVLEDSAQMIAGFVAVHSACRASADSSRSSGDDWLGEAVSLADAAIDAFADAATGRLFDTRAGRPDLFVRAGSTYDGATPSAGSAMINALIDLAEASGESRFRDAALRALGAISGPVAESPVSTCNATRALFRVLRLGWPLGEHLQALGAADTENASASDPTSEPDVTPVEIYADAERLSVTPDEPAALQLVMKIRDGYHIIAAQQDGDAPDLVPLRVELRGGGGAAVFADYPEGEPLAVSGVGDAVRVHTGDVEFPVMIERQGETSGRPILTVSFQACTDTECQLPRTVELDVALDLSISETG